jgi:subtilisin family serine protease
MRRYIGFVLLLFGSCVAQAKTLVVAVIDSGIDRKVSHLCEVGHKSWLPAHTPLWDYSSGHGTHVAGLINRNAGNNDNYCMVSLQYFSPYNSGWDNLANEEAALRYAIDIHVDIINLSGGGPLYFESEYVLVKEALDRGIKVVVAAGNDGDNLDKGCGYYPACYDKRLVVVGNLVITKDYKVYRASTSNYGMRVNRWEIGTNVKSDSPSGEEVYKSGTSMATAVATGKLVREQLRSSR